MRRTVYVIYDAHGYQHFEILGSCLPLSYRVFQSLVCRLNSIAKNRANVLSSHRRWPSYALSYGSYGANTKRRPLPRSLLPHTSGLGERPPASPARRRDIWRAFAGFGVYGQGPERLHSLGSPAGHIAALHSS